MITRNNHGMRDATIYAARETENLRARLANNQIGEISREMQMQFKISHASVVRLLRSCGLEWGRKAAELSVTDRLTALEQRVQKLEQGQPERLLI